MDAHVVHPTSPTNWTSTARHTHAAAPTRIHTQRHYPLGNQRLGCDDDDRGFVEQLLGVVVDTREHRAAGPGQRPQLANGSQRVIFAAVGGRVGAERADAARSTPLEGARRRKHGTAHVTTPLRYRSPAKKAKCIARRPARTLTTGLTLTCFFAAGAASSSSSSEGTLNELRLSAECDRGLACNNFIRRIEYSTTVPPVSNHSTRPRAWKDCHNTRSHPGSSRCSSRSRSGSGSRSRSRSGAGCCSGKCDARRCHTPATVQDGAGQASAGLPRSHGPVKHEARRVGQDLRSSNTVTTLVVTQRILASPNSCRDFRAEPRTCPMPSTWWRYSG